MRHGEDIERTWSRFLDSRQPQDRETLVNHYWPHMSMICGKFFKRLPASSLTIDDITSFGAEGLLAGIDTYNPSWPLLPWLTLKIRGAIRDGLRREDWLSRSARDRLRKTLMLESELAVELGHWPSAYEVSQRDGLSEAQVRQAHEDEIRVHVSSLNEIEADESAPAAWEPEEIVCEQESEREVEAQVLEVMGSLAALPLEQQRVVTMIFYEEKSLRDTAAVMKTTTARVAELRDEALAAIREAVA